MKKHKNVNKKIKQFTIYEIQYQIKWRVVYNSLSCERKIELGMCATKIRLFFVFKTATNNNRMISTTTQDENSSLRP